MKVKLVYSNLSFPDLERIGPEHIRSALFIAQQNARVCQSSYDFEELSQEKFNEKLVKGIIQSGHHTPFETIGLTFELQDVPKAFAMVLNNEPPYSTCEKSARHKKMSGVSEEQTLLYKKWKEIFKKEIDNVYPKRNKEEKRNSKIEQLAKENARYMTSAFSNTNMIYTTNWRQLNYLLGFFNEFEAQEKMGKDYSQQLIQIMNDFSKQVSALKVEGLVSKTDQHLSLFNSRKVEEHFGDTYSTSYLASFATLGQAQRHRTIRYHVSDGLDLGAPLGFFIPPIIKETRLENEWISDLTKVSANDFPQAQLLEVNETGNLSAFRQKTILRLCGHAQLEIMLKTRETAEKYGLYQENYKIATPCAQNYSCNSHCAWGNKALERKI